MMALSRWIVENRAESEPDPNVFAGELLRLMDDLARERRLPGHDNKEGVR